MDRWMERVNSKTYALTAKFLKVPEEENVTNPVKENSSFKTHNFPHFSAYLTAMLGPKMKCAQNQ